MSNQCTAWAQRCKVGSGPAKAVLAYLADRASDDGTGAYPKVRTICEVTEFSERTVRSALKLLEERGFIRPGDQRHAALGRGGRTRPKQYRATVWDLCVERDPEVLAYLERTHREESVAPEGTAPSEDQSRPSSRGAAPAPLEDGPREGCSSRTPGGAAAAPLYKPSGNNHHDPLVPSGHSPEARHAMEPGDPPEQSALGLIGSIRSLLEKLGLPVPQDVARPTRREINAAVDLLAKHGEQDTLALVRWALSESDGWWRPHLRTCRQIAKHWDAVSLQRSRDEAQKAKNGKARDPHRPNTVSSALVSRVAVYGYSVLGLGACQAHLDGEMDSAVCPVCQFDARNRNTHMSAAERKRRLAREEEQTQPADQSDQTGTATHHFIGRRKERAES